MLTANRTNSKSPAQVSVKKSASAARAAGITATEVRRLLAGGRLGRTIPDHEMREITKGIKFSRWAMLTKAISQCDKRLRVKGLPDDIWVAIIRAKLEYLAGMAQLTAELDEIAKGSAAGSNGQASPHAFGPREQIGTVTAVSVSIGNKASEQTPVTDPQSIPSIRNLTIDPHSPRP